MDSVATEPVSLAELQERREGLVRQLQLNGIDLATVFQELYARPDHFVLELLQNAQDCGAREVEFVLRAGVLEFRHRGGKDFSLRDLDAITSLGNSTKPSVESEAKIGRFGVGFKSVFGICAEPEIHSGPFHVRIERQFVPKQIDSISIDSQETLFVFEIRETTNHKVIADALRGLDFDILLHLDHVTMLRAVVDGEEVRSIERISAPWDRDPSVEHVILGNTEGSLEYLLFSRSVEHLPGLRPGNRVQVVWPFWEEAIDVDNRTTYVAAFFPLDGYDVGDHPFGFQAPFLTTPARDRIREDEPGNDALWQELLELLRESLISLGRQGFLSSEVWNAFDQNKLSALQVTFLKGHHKVRHDIWETLRATTAEGYPMLPGLDGEPVCSGYAFLAPEKSIPGIVSNSMLQVAREIPNASWVLPTVEEDDPLYEFLVDDVGVQEFGFQELCQSLPQLKESLNDLTWNLNLLRIVKENGTQAWQSTVADSVNLAEYPLLPDKAGLRHPLLTRELRDRIYLKARRKAEVPIIHPEIVKDEDLVQFLTASGLLEYDELEDLRRITEALKDSVRVSELGLAGIDLILREIVASAESLGDRVKPLYDELKEDAYLPAVDASGALGVWPIDTLYFADTPWGKMLKERRIVACYAPEVWANDPAIRCVLEAMGVASGPRVITTRIRTLSAAAELRERRGWLTGALLREPDGEDYSVEHLKELMTQSSLNLTRLVLDMVIHDQIDRKFRKARYSWFYYTRQPISLDANWVHLIRTCDWFLNGDAAPRKLEDVSLDELAALGFEVNAARESELLEVFGFRPSRQRTALDELPALQRVLLEELESLTSQEQRELFEEIRARKRRQVTEAVKVPMPHPSEDYAVAAVQIGTTVGPTVGLPIFVALANGEPEAPFDEADSVCENDENIPDVSTWDICVCDTHEPRRVSDPKLDPPSNDADTSSGASRLNPPDQESKPPRLPPNRQAARRAEELVLQHLREQRLPGATWTESRPGVWAASDQYGTTIEIHDGNAAENSEGWDIAVWMDGELVELIEVKSTYSDADAFDLSSSQWQMANRQDHQRRSFTLVAVQMDLESNPPKATIMMLDNLLHRWRDGEVTCDPVRVQVRFPKHSEPAS